MAHERRFRFGVQASTAATAADWAALARRIEDLGYSSLCMPDHFGDQLAPIPALMAAADATTELRVGALVFDNDYRHPVVLAKELATLDVLSGGRLEFGIGAGWMNTDYEQSGIPHDPRRRARRAGWRKASRSIKGLFADGAFDFSGEHYTITGLDGLPKPVQTPHPPFLIGGGGKRVLSIAAREADIIGINPALTSGAVDAEHRGRRDGERPPIGRSHGSVRRPATRFDEIELNMLLFAVIVTDDREGTAENMGPLFGLSAEEVLDMPLALIGTHDQMAETLQERRERWGFSYIVTQVDAMDALAPVVTRLAGR